MNAVTIHAPLTPKADTAPHVVKLKVFWKTTQKWKAADIADFRQSVPRIAERLRQEQYWNKDGDIRSNKFTCEDFAIRVLCEYASTKGLPVKLTTGVRTYRNMELYDAGEHDRYASNKYGFSGMVMLTFGAPDMLNLGNTKQVNNDAVMPGDLLAQMNEKNTARHVQVVIQNDGSTIRVIQGNQEYKYPYRALYWLSKKLGGGKDHSVANPAAQGYEGLPIIGEALYTRNGDKWSYKNLRSGFSSPDFLHQFVGRAWNFMEFNK